MQISHVSIYVRDQEEAFKWYSEKFGFQKAADMPMSPTARWVTMKLPEQPKFEVVLEHESMAPDAATAEVIHNLVGKSGMIVYEVANVRQLAAELKSKGVNFEMEPTELPSGTQAIGADLYGNRFILSQAPQGGYPTGL